MRTLTRVRRRAQHACTPKFWIWLVDLFCPIKKISTLHPNVHKYYEHRLKISTYVLNVYPFQLILSGVYSPISCVPSATFFREGRMPEQRYSPHSHQIFHMPCGLKGVLHAPFRPLRWSVCTVQAPFFGSLGPLCRPLKDSCSM